MAAQDQEICLFVTKVKLHISTKAQSSTNQVETTELEVEESNQMIHICSYFAAKNKPGKNIENRSPLRVHVEKYRPKNPSRVMRPPSLPWAS